METVQFFLIPLPVIIDFLDCHLFDDGHHVGVFLHHVVNIHRLKSISLRHSRNFLAAFSSNHHVIHHRRFAKRTALCPSDQLATIIVTGCLCPHIGVVILIFKGEPLIHVQHPHLGGIYRTRFLGRVGCRIVEQQSASLCVIFISKHWNHLAVHLKFWPYRASSALFRCAGGCICALSSNGRWLLPSV